MHARGRYFLEAIVCTTFPTLFNRNRRVRFLTYALLTIGEKKQLLMVTKGSVKNLSMSSIKNVCLFVLYYFLKTHIISFPSFFV